MDFIFDNIYILLIVAGGIASWIKNQREAKEEREQEEHRRRAMAEQAKQKSESESDFEFEEKNNPPKAQYPRQASAPAVPPPIPRSAPAHIPTPAPTPAPRLRKAGTTPVEVPDFSAEIARQQSLLEQLKEVKKAKPERREAPARPTYSYSEKAKPVTTRGVISRLKNRSEIRQAIVLKEILDKPLGLR